MSKEAGAVLRVRTEQLTPYPEFELDGHSLNHCLRGIEIHWQEGEIIEATLTVMLREVDLDVMTLCYLIGKTEAPARIEEAIRALKRIKAEVTDGRE